MNLTHTLLLLMVACLVGLIFANEIPGAWWQWALSAVILFVAAGIASASDERGED